MNNKIPVKASPNQSIITVVNVNNTNIQYQLNFVYRDKLGYWTMDIIDYTTNNMVLSNVPLLSINDKAAYVDIIRQMSYLNIGSMFVIKTSEVADDSPTFNTIASNFALVWGDNYDD